MPDNFQANEGHENGSALGTVIAYHGAIDRGHATAGIDLFTEDAVFEVRGEILAGRAAITRFLVDREALTDRHTVHVVANAQVVEEIDEATVTALVLLHVQQPDGGYVLERVLDTVHQLHRHDGRWRVHHRHSHPLHSAPHA